MTDPTAFLQSNKLATLEGATRALESLVATILYLYCELVVSRLDWANQNGRIVVVVDGDSASFPLINNIVDLDSTPINFVSSSVDMSRSDIIYFIDEYLARFGWLLFVVHCCSWCVADSTDSLSLFHALSRAFTLRFRCPLREPLSNLLAAVCLFCS